MKKQIVALALLPLIPAIIYSGYFRNNSIGGPTDWSNFGQYIDGISGLIISLILLVIAYREYLKKRELDVEASRKNNLDKIRATIDSLQFYDLERVKAQLYDSAKVTKCPQGAQASSMPASPEIKQHIIIETQPLRKGIEFFHGILEKFIDEQPIPHIGNSADNRSIEQKYVEFLNDGKGYLLSGYFSIIGQFIEKDYSDRIKMTEEILKNTSIQEVLIIGLHSRYGNDEKFKDITNNQIFNERIAACKIRKYEKFVNALKSKP